MKDIIILLEFSNVCVCVCVFLAYVSKKMRRRWWGLRLCPALCLLNDNGCQFSLFVTINKVCRRPLIFSRRCVERRRDGVQRRPSGDEAWKGKTPWGRSPDRKDPSVLFLFVLLAVLTSAQKKETKQSLSQTSQPKKIRTTISPQSDSDRSDSKFWFFCGASRPSFNTALQTYAFFFFLLLLLRRVKNETARTQNSEAPPSQESWGQKTTWQMSKWQENPVRPI